MVAACSGGTVTIGDSGPAPAGTTTGSATKGIVQNGVVTIFELPDRVEIGSGMTNDNGEYTLQYADYQGGLVEICVTPADTGTTIVCDASDGTNCGPAPMVGAPGDNDPENGRYDLGERIPAPAGFEMCTRLSAPPADGVQAPITPFTQAVVARAAALEANDTPAVALQNAASEINQILGGIDVLRQSPINFADADARDNADPQALAYSALLASVTSNDVANNTTVDVGRIVSDVVSQVGGGQVRLNVLDGYVQGARRQLNSFGRSDRSGLLAVLQDVVDNTPGDTFDPEPTPVVTQSRVERARNLIRNVRTRINSLDEYEQPLEAFGLDVDGAVDVFDANGVLGENLFLFLDAAVTFFDTSPECQDETCSFTQDGVTANASASGGTTTITVTGTDSDGVTFDLRGTAPSNMGDNSSNLTLAITNSSVSNSQARLRIANGTLNAMLNTPFDFGAADDEDPSNDQDPDIIDTASFVFAGAAEVLDNGAVTASASGDIELRGLQATQCELEAEDPDDRGLAQFNVSLFRVGGALTSGTQTANTTFAVTLANGRSFCPLSTVGPDNVPQVAFEFTAAVTPEGEDPARLVFTGALNDLFERAGFDAPPQATTTLRLLRGGSVVFALVVNSVEPSGNQGSLTINATLSDVNNAAIGFTTTLDVPSNDDRVIGLITVDGQRVGVLREVGDGLLIARFDDGSFESLF